jgi:pyruvate kinase
MDARVSTEHAIAAAATSAVRSLLGAPALIVFTKSGFSGAHRRVASSQRADPGAHGCGAHLPAARAGVGGDPELVPHCDDVRRDVRAGARPCERRGLAKRGDRVVVTAGVPFDVPGTTNLLRVEVV